MDYAGFAFRMCNLYLRIDLFGFRMPCFWLSTLPEAACWGTPQSPVDRRSSFCGCAFCKRFSGPRRLSYVWSRAGLVRKTKRKEPGLEVSFPLNPAFYRLYRSITQNIQLFFLHYSCCFSFISLRIVVLAAFNKSVSIRIS